MNKHNENLMDSILLSMAATTLSKRLNNSLNDMDDNEMSQNIRAFDNNVLKDAMRKNDCYTHVSKHIGDNLDNDETYNGTIRVYSLAGSVAHCVLINERKDIISDDFDSHRKSYNPKNGDIEYDTSMDFNNIPMSKNYELGKESFEIPVKDYLKVVEKVQPLIKLHKERPDEDKGKLISMINQGFSIEDALDLSLMSNESLKNESIKSNNKNKI